MNGSPRCRRKITGYCDSRLHGQFTLSLIVNAATPPLPASWAPPEGDTEHRVPVFNPSTILMLTAIALRHSPPHMPIQQGFGPQKHAIRAHYGWLWT
jgi:hypothetical protein